MSALEWLIDYAAVPCLVAAAIFAVLTAVSMVLVEVERRRSQPFRDLLAKVRAAREANPYTEEWREAQDRAFRG